MSGPDNKDTPTPPGHSPHVSDDLAHELVTDESTGTGEIGGQARDHAVSVLLGFCALHQACRLYDMNNKVVRRVLEEGMERARNVRRGQSPAMEQVGEILLEKEQVDGDELREILAAM